MSYSTGKYIEKSRGKAMKMLVIEKKPVGVVANRFLLHFALFKVKIGFLIILAKVGQANC